MGVESGNCKIYTLLFIFQDISLGTFSETVFKQKSIQKKASLCENIKQASVFLFVCVCVCVGVRERERESRHGFQQRQLLAIACGIQLCRLPYTPQHSSL